MQKKTRPKFCTFFSADSFVHAWESKWNARCDKNNSPKNIFICEESGKRCEVFLKIKHCENEITGEQNRQELMTFMTNLSDGLSSDV